MPPMNAFLPPMNAILPRIAEPFQVGGSLCRRLIERFIE
jgi:hypothetical protein